MFIRSGVERSRKPSGFSLLELLVASTLSLMLLGILFRLIVPSIKASSKGLGQVDLHQRALLLADRLERDLRLTIRAGVGYFPAEQSLVIHPRNPVISDVVWSSKILSYRLEGESLLRFDNDLDRSPPSALVPTPEQLSLMPRSLTSSFQGVKSFQVQTVDGPLIKVSYSFQAKGETLDWSKSVFLRNSAQ